MTICTTLVTLHGVMKMAITGLLDVLMMSSKSSGYRIGPFEVESAMMTHPAVVECAVTGVPDEVRGMVVKLRSFLPMNGRKRLVAL